MQTESDVLDASPLDHDSIEALRELREPGEPDPLAELVEAYLLDTPERLEDMRRGIMDRNYELLSRTAHSLKGSSSNFGASRMTALCRRVEQAAKETALDGIEDLVTQIEFHYPELKSALESERSR